MPVSVQVFPRVWVFVTLALAASACSTTGPDEALLDGEVIVAAGEGQILISNGTDERVYYTAFPASVVPVINWAPHIDQEPAVEAGNQERFQLDEAWTIEAGEEIIVYWWVAVERDGRRVPGEVRFARVDAWPG
ncbi:MAG: hypothetical protein AAF752_06140 [Bacteroidota bacterium]